jgi:hypothetical protein
MVQASSWLAMHAFPCPSCRRCSVTKHHSLMTNAARSMNLMERPAKIFPDIDFNCSDFG